MSNLPSNPSYLKVPLGVVACDAGAANLIAAWAPLLPSFLTICAEGPAKDIFTKAWPLAKFSTMEEVIVGSKMVLTGTGWSSNLEHDARRFAIKAGIPTIAVIDHWVNYPERFIRDNEQILPDVIVVTDKYAELLAKQCFENIFVVQWPNCYLEVESKKIRAMRLVEAKSSPQNVLIVMEPIRGAWPGDTRHGEFVAVDYFISNLHLIGLVSEWVKMKIRPHPSDAAGKYTQVVKEYFAIDITISEGASLVEDIAWADWVVGCESFALVVALQAGVPTMSILPPQAPRCRLPHRGLQHLNDLVS